MSRSMRLGCGMLSVLCRSRISQPMLCLPGSVNLGSRLSTARGFSSSPGAGSAEQQAAEKMLDMIGKSPQLQKMVMASLPVFMRSPAMMEKIFADPKVRAQIAEFMAAKKVVIPPHILERLGSQNLEETFARADKMGINPVDQISKLMSHPELTERLKEPLVLSAFMDISQFPENISKYDASTQEVLFKIKNILASPNSAPASDDVAAIPSSQPQESVIHMSEGVPTEGASSPEAASGTSTTDGQQSGDASAPYVRPTMSLNPLVALMQSDPVLALKLENPDVMQALEEVNKSPWKTVRWIFNKEVMEAFKVGPSVLEQSTTGSESASISRFSENSDHQKSSTGNADYQSGSSPGSSGSSGNRLVDMAMSDPELAKKLENPDVMQALNDVNASMWNIFRWGNNMEVQLVIQSVMKIAAARRKERRLRNQEEREE